MTQPQLLVAQLGAREHYAVAAMAEQHSALSLLITDFWNPCGNAALRLAEIAKSRSAMRAAGRFSKGIPNRKVVSLHGVVLRSCCSKLSFIRRPADSDPASWVNIGRRFAGRATAFLDVSHCAFFGYSCASLEILREERLRGRRAVLGQIDAGAQNVRIVNEEQTLHTKLALPTAVPPKEYFARVRAEWEAASAILVNSAWTRSALIEEGTSPDKIHVVPLTIARPPSTVAREPRGRRLRVLWLGNLTLLKGAAYAIEAARQLESAGVTVTFVGTLGISRPGLRLPSNATYVGAVPQSEVSAWYRSHDVFLFPTLSDGFGVAQLEALSHGLPVIATPNCGQVVEHRRSGFVVPPRDPAAISGAVLEMQDDPLLFESLSNGAISRCEAFAPERVWPLMSRALFGPENPEPGGGESV